MSAIRKALRAWFVVVVAGCGGNNPGRPDAPIPDAPADADMSSADAPIPDAPIADAPNDGPVSTDAAPDGSSPDAANNACSGILDVPTIVHVNDYAGWGRAINAGTINVMIWTSFDLEDFYRSYGRLDSTMHLEEPWWTHELDLGGAIVHAALGWSGSTLGLAYQEIPRHMDAEPYATVFRKMSLAGDPASDSVVLEEAVGSPFAVAVAWDPVNAQWGVAWNSGEGTVVFARIAENGTLVPGSQVDISPGAGEISPEAASPLIWNGSELALVWTRTTGVAITRIGLPGTPLQTIAVPTSAPPSSADLAWSGSQYGITWLDGAANKSRFALVDDGGLVPGSAHLVGLDSGPPSMVWTGTGYAVAWAAVVPGARKVWLQRFAPDATPAGQTQLTCGPPEVVDMAPVILFDGDLSVVYTSRLVGAGYDPDVRILHQL